MNKVFFFDNDRFIYARDVTLSESGIYAGWVVNGAYKFTYDTNTMKYTTIGGPLGGPQLVVELTWACTIHVDTDDYNMIYTRALQRRESGEPSDLYAPPFDNNKNSLMDEDEEYEIPF